ncbi:MAG: AtpZ/AtpI family protein [Acidimicrobiia bacterium]
MDLLREKRELNRGFGDSMARASELALTSALFAGLGYLLDRWIGIFPVLTIVLFLFAVAGQFVKMWYAYDAEMRAHERRMTELKKGAKR